MDENEHSFISDLISEREQRMDEWQMGVVAEYNCEKDGMERKEDVECCCCLNVLSCVKLPNCDHFICPKCYHKIYHGFISNDFYHINRRPVFGQENPEYPYKNADENTEIYNRLNENTVLNVDIDIQKSMYEDWFIHSNEDLYTSINEERDFLEEFVKTKPYETLLNIKDWFENDKKIKKYEEDLIKFHVDYKLFEENSDLYERLCEENRKNNCVKK